ncbi:MAG: hypothetical protein ACRDRB_25945 [Pseudonocardiaceae bacterium]
MNEDGKRRRSSPHWFGSGDPTGDPSFSTLRRFWILGGRRVTIRIEQATLMFFDPDTRELLRTRTNPLTYDQAAACAAPAPPAHHPGLHSNRSPHNAGPRTPGSS